ncbi:S1C family serine protease [Planctomycetota bacterium]
MPILVSCVLCAFFFAAGPAVSNIHAADTASIQLIAEVGNAATVAVYCKRGKYETYYGTGAVISADGYILTSTTVVPKGAEEVKIFFTDHSKKKAKIVEIHEKMEATLLKVDADRLTFFPVSIKTPMLGETCYTWGNANNSIRLGENASFSSGIVSGVYQVRSNEQQSSYEGLAIESDAAINPGQDGGPLCNSQGQLVGIISLSYSDLRWQGVAIPLPLILKNLATVMNRRVKLNRKPIYEPGSSSAQEKAFLYQLNNIAKSLVQLKVKRKYPPEKIGIGKYSEILKSLGDQDEQDVRRKLASFFQADRIISGNQQLRRPDQPVTGVLISPKGVILTSLFNVSEDTVFVHKNKGLIAYEYKDDLRKDLFPYAGNEYKRETNKIESITAVVRGREYKAEILGKSVPLGVALLKIRSTSLPYLDIKKVSAKPKVGQTVAAIGIMPSPGTYAFTLNTGIVSTAQRRRGLAFQFDAILNYGNSGGPVIGLDGKFLGLAGGCLSGNPIMGRLLNGRELLRWTTSLNSGVSFGARADKILVAVPKLMKGENIDKFEGPFIGVQQDPRTTLSNEVKLGQIVKGSPAEKGGLKKGDIITHINGIELGSWKHMLDILLEHKVGDKVIIKVKRGNQELDITVTLGERK